MKLEWESFEVGAGPCEPVKLYGKIKFLEPQVLIQLDKTLRLPRKQKKRLKNLGKDWKRIAFNKQING